MDKKKLYLKYVFYLLRKKRLRKFLNLFTVYPLWLNFKMRGFIVNKLFPAIKYEPYAPFIEIEPTTVCPLRCAMCEHTYWDEPARNMSFKQFKGIVDQLPHLKWIGLTGIGESFSNPDFMQMVEYVSNTSKPIIELVDNFFLLDEKKAEKIIKMGVDIQFISMCGATKETNDKIMKNSSFETVIKNIKDFVRVKKQLGSVTPLLNFHYILFKDNQHEALQFLDLIDSLDAEVFEILYTPLLHGFKEIQHLEMNERDVLELKKKIIEKAKKIGINVSFNESVFEKKPSISQCANWIMPFVFVTGEVIPCCTMNEANNRDYQKKYSIGNVFEQRFRDIWYGSKSTAFKKQIRQGKTPLYCAGCPVYRYDKK